MNKDKFYVNLCIYDAHHYLLGVNCTFFYPGVTVTCQIMSPKQSVKF